MYRVGGLLLIVFAATAVIEAQTQPPPPATEKNLEGIQRLLDANKTELTAFVERLGPDAAGKVLETTYPPFKYAQMMAHLTEADDAWRKGQFAQTISRTGEAIADINEVVGAAKTAVVDVPAYVIEGVNLLQNRLQLLRGYAAAKTAIDSLRAHQANSGNPTSMTSTGAHASPQRDGLDTTSLPLSTGGSAVTDIQVDGGQPGNSETTSDAQSQLDPNIIKAIDQSLRTPQIILPTLASTPNGAPTQNGGETASPQLGPHATATAGDSTTASAGSPFSGGNLPRSTSEANNSAPLVNSTAPESGDILARALNSIDNAPQIPEIPVSQCDGIPFCSGSNQQDAKTVPSVVSPPTISNGAAVALPFTMADPTNSSPAASVQPVGDSPSGLQRSSQDAFRQSDQGVSQTQELLTVGTNQSS